MEIMADNPKLDLASPPVSGKFEDNVMGSQKISVLDHLNGFQYSTADKSDGFVIDMESFSNGTNKDINNANSRITLQRSLSRKGPQRGYEKKISSIAPANDRETETTNVAVSSPRVVGPSTPEKAMAVTTGTTDHLSNLPVHHQITITTANISTATESRCTTRRNSFKRSSSSWALDPKRVLFLFATLSSMGTMLLIYFTLSMGKLNANDNALD